MHLDSVCMGERRHNNPQTCWGQVCPQQSSAKVSGISRRELFPAVPERCGAQSHAAAAAQCPRPAAAGSQFPFSLLLSQRFHNM